MPRFMVYYLILIVMGDLQCDLAWPLFYQRQKINNISSHDPWVPRGAVATVDAGYIIHTPSGVPEHG